jgi:large conductance mechanosensitive channel
LIVAFVLFVVIRLMNRLVRAEAAKAPAPSRQEELLTEIRDLLKSPAKQPVNPSGA